jgi:hypothetical protein
VGWTNRTDGRSSFAGYRIQKDLVMESRRLTHELASRGQAVWLSPKGEETLPFTFWSVWAETSAAPAGWDYAAQCAKWDRIPPPPLDLGRYVRFINIRRSTAQAEARPAASTQHRAASPPAPGGAPQPAAVAVAPPRAGGPQEAPAQGRRRRRPKPTSLISYVPPQKPKRSAPAPGRFPSTASQPPLPYPTPAAGSPEPNRSDSDHQPDLHAIDAAVDDDSHGVSD